MKKLLRWLIKGTVISSMAIGGGVGYGFYTTSPDAPNTPYEIVAVYDADTYTVLINGNKEKVRAIGVNSPEVGGKKGKECYGFEARDFAKRRLEGRTVTLTRDKHKKNRDLYGRLLRYVQTDNKLVDFNEELLLNGMARYAGYGKIEKAQLYKDAEDLAKEFSMGMWLHCSYDQTPTSTVK